MKKALIEQKGGKSQYIELATSDSVLQSVIVFVRILEVVTRSLRSRGTGHSFIPSIYLSVGSVMPSVADGSNRMNERGGREQVSSVFESADTIA